MQWSMHLGQALEFWVSRQNPHGNPNVGLEFIDFVCVLEPETSQIRPYMFYAAELSRLSSLLADRAYQILCVFFK